jgi:peptidylprolyl isomerase
MVIKENNKVEIEYTGTLDGGEVFDSNSGKEPLVFEIGAGMVIPGFEKAVIDMKRGETKKIKIPPKEAYGEKIPGLEKKIKKYSLPKGQEPKEGMVLVLSAPNGQKIPAKITLVEKEEITIDMNHPLAGKNLNFEIKLLNIIPKD